MINYKLLDDSINFYEKEKFQRIESPWVVSEKVSNITKPEDRINFQLKHNNKCLVASAEQSFLYLYLKGFLPKGQFQSITPCFRYESFDFLHSKYFIKNELIKTDSTTQNDLEFVIDTAYKFYKTLFGELDIVKNYDGFDIEYHGNELGSYGIRECEYLRWIYGTGCAEPRTSSLINLSYGIS